MFSDTKCVVDFGKCAVDFGGVCCVKYENYLIFVMVMISCLGNIPK